ncbi:MAG: HlyD family efflux transporter periplasmic adaptor subunit [Clostridia bacterium]
MPSGIEVDTTIENIIEEDEERIIVFKIDKAVQELINYRKISLDVIWWSESGKKIPNTAIGYEEKNDKQVPYVIRIRAGYTNKILVKILKQNEKYAIVDNYKSEELEELGYDVEEIENRKKIVLYDEIIKNAK